MSDAGSTSTTDIKLFQALANPEQTSTFAKPIIEHTVDDDNNSVSSASATSVLTIIGVTILLLPVLRRTWRDFREKK